MTDTAPYLAEVAARTAAILGERLVGVWLGGSAALGDFDPARSDLDVQAVSTVVLPTAERERLAAALAHDALPCPVRGLEFVLYAREGLADPAGPAFQLNLNTGPGMEHHAALDPAADPRFWFVIDVSILREHGQTLRGAAAESAFPALPRPLVLAALRAGLEWYGGSDAGAEQRVLSACRTWAWATDGRWRSKADAARWARPRLEDPAPVDRALALRDGRPTAKLTETDIAAVLARTYAALEGAPPEVGGLSRAWSR